MTDYNTSFVYCRELASGTVNLVGKWVRDDDSKQTSNYTIKANNSICGLLSKINENGDAHVMLAIDVCNISKVVLKWFMTKELYFFGF